MRFLIICRDNIGDTLLTTPLISALAQSGQHQVDVLTNNYAAPVLQHNPDIRQLFYYTKLHHREAGQGRLACITATEADADPEKTALRCGDSGKKPLGSAWPEVG